MDPTQEAVDETAKSVNPLDLSASGPSESTMNENASTEALIKVSQDMERVLDRLTAPRAPSDVIRKHGVEEFHGTSMEESDKVEFWLEKLERVLDETKCPMDQKVTCAVSLMQGEAYDWWKLVLRNPLIPDPVTWDYFVSEFNTKYVTDDYKESKWKKFLTLRQGKMTVAEYEKEFSRLSKYASESVLTEKFKCGQFEEGLHESIKRYLTAVTSLQSVNFYQLVQVAIKIEKSKIKSQERNKEKKFSRGGSSSRKRPRESQSDSVRGPATRGRRQGPTMTQSSGRGISTGQEEKPVCPHCHNYHSSICRRVTGGCFRCGSTEHVIANCPRGLGSSRNPQGSGRGGSNVPPQTQSRGRGRSGSQGRGNASETVNRPATTAPARAYAMRAREDPDIPGVIVGTFTLFDIDLYALIDPGSTHSYICMEQMNDKLPTVELLDYDLLVTSPLGHSVRVNRVYKNCPLMVHDREFSVDLIAFPFHEFDLILGMDWLSKHRAIVDCDKKIVLLKCPDLSEVRIQGIRSESVPKILSAMKARRFLKKGCEAFLALILDSKREQVNLENIPVIREFPDVFPEELPGVPPE